MDEQTGMTAENFFWNAAAQESGFSAQFWLDAYNRYLGDVELDPSPMFEAWEVERTVRVPFGSGQVDVLVRIQPDGREYAVLRFTVFPAAEGPEPRRFDRWYWYGSGEETPPALGEAALLDYAHRW